MTKIKELFIEFKLKRTNMISQDELTPLLSKFLDLSNKLKTSHEVFMALYLALTRFESSRVFYSLLMKNDHFKDTKPDWCLLLNELEIF